MPRRRHATESDEDSDVRVIDNNPQFEFEDVGPLVGRIDSDEESETETNNAKSRSKKLKLEEPGPSTSNADAGDMDGCSICFEHFTAVGDHRLVSLKCGHFFGNECIVRWLHGEKGRGCPTCKSKARMSDIRAHFAVIVKAQDNTEVEELRTQLMAHEKENEGLRLELVRLRKQLEVAAAADVPLARAPIVGQFILIQRKRHQLTRVGECRAFAFSPQLIIVASPLHTLGGGADCGVQFLDNAFGQMQPPVALTQKRIRTIEICPFDYNLYFAGSEDGSVLLRSVDGAVMKRTRCRSGVWTSTWIAHDHVVVGCATGEVVEVKTDDVIPRSLIPSQNGMCGVIQLAYFPDLQALLVVRLKGVQVWRHGRLSTHLQAITQMKVQECSVSVADRSFVLCIPHSHSTMHHLCTVSVENEEVVVVAAKTFSSPSFRFSYMWRNAVFRMADSLVSAIFQEELSRIVVHDWSGQRDDKYLTVGGLKVTHIRGPPTPAEDKCILLILSENVISLATLAIA